MEEKDYDALIDMFASDGWKYFVEGKTELLKALINNAPDGAPTNDQWQFARGQSRELRATTNCEKLVDLTWKEQQAMPVLEEDEVNVDLI